MGLRPHTALVRCAHGLFFCLLLAAVAKPCSRKIDMGFRPHTALVRCAHGLFFLFVISRCCKAMLVFDRTEAYAVKYLALCKWNTIRSDPTHMYFTQKSILQGANQSK
jgi:hypothetical protein